VFFFLVAFALPVKHKSEDKSRKKEMRNLSNQLLMAK
jgi:hypothetical protein